MRELVGVKVCLLACLRDELVVEAYYRRFAAHLEGDEKARWSFERWGAFPSWERLREMVGGMIAYGKKHAKEPTGGGTTQGNDDLDWDEETWVDNPCADSVRELYRVWRLWDHSSKSGAKKKEEHARREQEARDFREQAKRGRQSPPPKVSAC